MGVLDVSGVAVVGFPVDTTITTSDGQGGSDTFVAKADTWYGTPANQMSMTVSPVGKAMCMLRGTKVDYSGTILQVMTVDEIRISV